MNKLLLFAYLFIASALLASSQNSAVSSHFTFDGDGEADIISLEVRVPEDGIATYTYYKTLGWQGNAGGYAGIQESPYGRNYIFSIWDNENQRGPIKAVYTGHGTTTETFGGEGTGLKSWNFDIPWETNAWYSLNARCWPVNNNTYYGFWIRDGVSGEWKHLVTMDVDLDDLTFPSKNGAFIEDWMATGHNRREMHMRNSWRRRTSGEWVASSSGTHQVNYWDFDDPTDRSYNYKTNWDAGTDVDETGPYYYMISGGEDTENSIPNGTTFSISQEGNLPDYLPGELKNLTADYSGYYLLLNWDIVKTKLPQFSYKVYIYDNPEHAGAPLSDFHEGAPHEREVKLSFKHLPGDFYGKIVMVDLFDNEHSTNFTFNIPDLNHDIGIDNLSTTNDLNCTSSTTDLNFEVTNYGSEELTSFTTKIYVNGDFHISKAYSTSLLRFESDKFIFTGLDLGAEMQYDLTVEVTAPNGLSDESPANNTASIPLKFEGEIIDVKDISTFEVSSQASGTEPAFLFDNDANTIWHNDWPVDAPLPHTFVFDLGQNYKLSGIDMLNRQDNSNGQPKDAEIHTSTDNENWALFKQFEFDSTIDWQTLSFNGLVDARYVKLIITSNFLGDNVCSMAELRFRGCNSPISSSPEINKTGNFKIRTYPNPVSNNLHVDCELNSPIQIVKLIDQQGRVIITEKKPIGFKNANFDIHTGNLPSGHYYLIISSKTEVSVIPVLKR